MNRRMSDQEMRRKRGIPKAIPLVDRWAHGEIPTISGKPSVVDGETFPSSKKKQKEPQKDGIPKAIPLIKRWAYGEIPEVTAKAVSIKKTQKKTKKRPLD